MSSAAPEACSGSLPGSSQIVPSLSGASAATETNSRASCQSTAGGQNSAPTTEAGILSTGEGQPGQLSWQQLTDILTALAAVDWSPTQKTAALRSTEGEVLKRLKPGGTDSAGDGATSTTLASILLALSALGEDPSPEVAAALFERLQPRLQSLQLQERCSVIGGLAKLRHHVGLSTVDRICSEVVERPASLPGDSLVDFIWGAANLGSISSLPALIPTLLSQQQRTRWQPEALGKLLWALAVGGLLSEEVAAALNVGAVAAEEGTLNPQAAQHLAAAYLALPALLQHLPQPLLLAALQARKDQVAAATTPKGTAEVAAILSELGLDHVEGLQLEQGLLQLDFALPTRQLALSLDAPAAFFTNQPELATGATVLDWRLLSMRGWKVVSLRLADWEGLEGRPQRTAYLRQLLQGPSALDELQSLLRRLQVDSAAEDSTRPTERSASLENGPSAGSSLPDIAPQQRPPEEQNLTSLARHLSNLSDQSLSRRASQEVLSSSLYGVGLGGSSSGEGGQRLPALTQRAAATNQGMYWDQVTLASRLAAMGMMPKVSLGVPPGAQPGAAEGLPSLALGRSSSELAVAPELAAASLMGLSGDLPQADMVLRPQLQLPQVPGGYSNSSLMGLAAGFPNPGSSLSSRLPAQNQPADVRQLWQMVTKVEPGQAIQGAGVGAKGNVSVGELKRVIELLPLEASAVNALAPRLALLDAQQFSSLLTELARDNHAFRAWQLFDWVRALPEESELRRLCDSHTYITMITLCGPWQQMQRALTLVADMRARSMDFGVEAYTALLTAAVKCGEVELAIDVYRQMGQEGIACDRPLYQLMVDVFVKMGRHSEALGVLDDMKRAGQPAEVQLYNLIVLSCTKTKNPRVALDVYKRMAEDGVQPNTKTFTALIGSVGKLSTMEQAMEIIEELLAHEQDSPNLTQTYSALMSACEKAGQWDLAVALFDKMSSQGCKPDAAIFNSMIAACAHGGEFLKARTMFERMPEHGCTPDAVTYANLIRAYKKGGRWCHALDTFEAMQRAGCRPHAAVFSSIIDVLWQTGSAWAQAKALRLFATAVENGSLAGPAESCKKGTLKVDLQALTVGVAMLSMATWLKQARHALLRDQAGPLDSCRKLAIVNGLGEHSRAQGHSAAVKEAVGAGLLGCKAPFRLVQDHSRSGRLEASTLALRKWLFSDSFDAYLKLLQGGLELQQQPLMSTTEYLDKEVSESSKCNSLFERILKYEQMHPVSLKMLHGHSGAHLAIHRQLVSLTLHYAAALQLSQETAHTALALMDRCIVAGITASDHLQTLLVCACLRLAAMQESAFLPSPLAIQALTNIPALALERMESTIVATLNNDTECITAVHCLKIYLQRLAVDLGDGEAVRRAAGCAFALATQALAELPLLQYPPSLTAAAVLVAARKAQGAVPFWPSVLAQMTGYTETSTPAFTSTIAHAERLCTKLCSATDGAYLLGGGGMT